MTSNGGKRTANLIRDGESLLSRSAELALSGLLPQRVLKKRLQATEVPLLFGLFTSPHMEGQLNAVAQTLLIKNATDVTLYCPQAEV